MVLRGTFRRQRRMKGRWGEMSSNPNIMLTAAQADKLLGLGTPSGGGRKKSGGTKKKGKAKRKVTSVSVRSRKRPDYASMSDAELLARIKRSGLDLPTKRYPQAPGRTTRAPDLQRRALPPGWRVSAKGNPYFENRKNRSDVSRRKWI